MNRDALLFLLHTHAQQKKNSPGVGEIFFSDVLDPRLMERPENGKCERVGNMKNVISEFSLQLTQIEPRISAIFIHTVERGYWCTQSAVDESLFWIKEQ